ncbi:uncharacterized protein G2W53_037299 [Senna tora]|uniref:Uncharacterized protein n=1 Tax=Senna tora TaxID=362788 RepID=A0A834SX20_9FABA|nr:uncharacterized protein G2W53_037299 [Senna tora]
MVHRLVHIGGPQMRIDGFDVLKSSEGGRRPFGVVLGVLCWQKMMRHSYRGLHHWVALPSVVQGSVVLKLFLQALEVLLICLVFAKSLYDMFLKRIMSMLVGIRTVCPPGTTVGRQGVISNSAPLT